MERNPSSMELCCANSFQRLGKGSRGCVNPAGSFPWQHMLDACHPNWLIPVGSSQWAHPSGIILGSSQWAHPSGIILMGSSRWAHQLTASSRHLLDPCFSPWERQSRKFKGREGKALQLSGIVSQKCQLSPQAAVPFPEGWRLVRG